MCVVLMHPPPSAASVLPPVVAAPWVRPQLPGCSSPQEAAVGLEQRWDIGPWDWDLLALADGQRERWLRRWRWL